MLGHQSIAQAFGAKIVKASKIMHGKTSTVTNLGSKLFKVSQINSTQHVTIA